MNNFSDTCFVCNSKIGENHFFVNPDVNLPVCGQCKGSDQEKDAVKELTESLADGFVCGCI
ncbi:MAG: hypothetical protein RBS73_16595 [Prolixibacteraceae bacterium]|jgi:hypothetical protein|nr:hypothetical protein [Prolixibacteraceae bacterium]